MSIVGLVGNILSRLVQRIQCITGSPTINITIPFRWNGYTMSNPPMPDIITVERITFTDKSTIGELHIDGDKFCSTLEDTCRKGPKIAGKTAIPMGRYQVIIDYSERFKKEMPHLLDVPGFEGIRIHSGNTSEDTLGCILLGMRTGVDVIYDSRIAYDKFVVLLKERLAKGPVHISVLGGGRDA